MIFTPMVCVRLKPKNTVAHPGTIFARMFSCVRTGVNTGVACICADMDLLRILADMWGISSGILQNGLV